jgi:ABC-type protease/lipase transport system fused ATPase/permease subunit
MIEAIMQKIMRRATVVLITHRPSEIAAVDKLLILRDGRVQDFGPKGEVFARNKVHAVLARVKVMEPGLVEAAD